MASQHYLDKRFRFITKAALEDVTKAALSPVPAAPKKPRHLLDLPNELLLLIIGMAVYISTKEDPIEVVSALESKRLDEGPEKVAAAAQACRLIQPAITRVCRFLRSEGLQMFYSMNTFLFEYDMALYVVWNNPSRWLSSIEPHNHKLIQNSYVRGEYKGTARHYSPIDCPVLLSDRHVLPWDFHQFPDFLQCPALELQWPVLVLKTATSKGQVVHERIGSGQAIRVTWKDKRVKLAAGEVWTPVKEVLEADKAIRDQALGV